jgi:hypothetical protein
MTVLADAAAIHVGDVAAVAVCQGSRRIWPPWTGTAAVGVFTSVPVETVDITVAATLAELEATATTIDLTFDQGALDWAANNLRNPPAWFSSDGRPMYVHVVGDANTVPVFADLIAARGWPLELRWTTGIEFELVFNP